MARLALITCRFTRCAPVGDARRRLFATASTSPGGGRNGNSNGSGNGSAGAGPTATNSPPPHLDNRVKIVEVGPRDGLQNEKKSIPLATKIDLIERLARTGLSSIEAGAFVSPKWVPQMSNSGQILQHILQRDIPSRTPLTFSFLAPNMTGMNDASAIFARHPTAFETETQRAASAAAGKTTAETTGQASKPAFEIAVFAAATESFSQRNLNCDIATALARFAPVIQAAKDGGLRVRAYISVVLGCPFEGRDVDPHRVAELATDLLEMGADEIALGDTTGMGTAPRTRALLACLRSAGVLPEDLAMHFHDTYGQALVNTAVALEHGIRTFDAAVGGLGGCPYSPGATGNVATEDMVYFLESLGMRTGVDLDAVADIGAWITREVGKPHESSVGKAVIGARSRAGSPETN
ncbi:hydroxymethylglutaryl-CoA lyase [Lasiosphaeria miniovina]|uniref:hydroxymethylglutaryl-CoA lyase n=1 Tax=Lasiosphaeria miniovina TaxID=1954250 RepID=A0AA39ZZ45_9PEZI|nr:hydroxymethylglutaryl-CoA lyase [Lasiosphaeria miniovina]KAK0706331.1 hydroxymethylglutaryl-CoA lyase [Lasiosphaeria miniovina]